MSAPQVDESGKPFLHVDDQCRVWEKRLSSEQKQEAFRIAERNGWQPGSLPPAWVWAEIYRQVDP